LELHIPTQVCKIAAEPEWHNLLGQLLRPKVFRAVEPFRRKRMEVLQVGFPAFDTVAA
jgi:hypothetical protein